MSEPSPAAACMRLIIGYQVSRAIYAGVALGVFDAMKEASSSDEIAKKTGTHAPTVYRLLRALAGVGVVEEKDDRCFSLTEMGRLLQKDAPGTLAPWAESIGRPYYWAAWSALPSSITTGEPAFPKVHEESIWDYRASHPEDGAVFDRAMAAVSQRVSRAVTMSYDFSRFGRVVDVGGGTGVLIEAILRRWKDVRGVLFDLPEAVSASTLPPELEARVERIPGSFFDALPPGGDAYVLCSVLHNWPDSDALQILERVRAVLAPDARLLVVESDTGERNRDPEVKILDLNMLVLHGSKERTKEELAVLFAEAKLAIVGETKTPLGLRVVETRAV